MKVHTILDEENPVTPQIAPTFNQVATSVPIELALLERTFNKHLDVMATIELSNIHAKADLVVNGAVIIPSVPVTVLMPLKKELVKLVPVFDSIATLDSAKVWELDDTYEKAGVYKSPVVTTVQTIINKKWVVIAEATPQHPAQLREVDDRVDVGSFNTTNYSGDMPQRAKDELLSRLNSLIEAVDTAISVANNSEVTPMEIGGKVTNYLLGGLNVN